MFKLYVDLVDVKKENIILKKELDYYKTFSYELQKCQNEARQLYYISNSLAFINKQSNPNVYISRVVGYDMSGKKSLLEIQNNGKIKERKSSVVQWIFVGVVYKVYKDVAYV
jgi:hypothetical protein